MSWEREPLFTKSRLFFEKAFIEDRESLFFGLLCTLGLELLLRSAVAKISPTLLAEPDKNHRNLLHVLGIESSNHKRKSIPITQVNVLCKQLIPNFRDEQSNTVSAMITRRNDELHSGSASFNEYPTQQWIAGFYEVCKILCEFQDESLETLLGEEIEKEAKELIKTNADKVSGETKSLIAAHKKVFENKSEEEQNSLKEEAEENAADLAYRRHHKVECPSCKCAATVTGETYGKEVVENKGNEIVVRKTVIPTGFVCTACGLKLNGYNSLKAAEVANEYTRKTVYSPEDYYGMIRLEEYERLEAKYDEINPYNYEWDNE